MKKLSLHSKASCAFVEIPVDFIDSYLPEAPEEALKVYLYLLRSFLDPTIILSLQDMADLFDVTPKKISQALAYWESLNVLSLEYSDGEISDVTILPISGTPSAPEKISSREAVTSEPVRSSSPKQEESSVQNLSFKQEAVHSQNSVVPQNVTKLHVVPEPEMPISLDDPAVQNLSELAQWYLKKPVSQTMVEAIAVCYSALSKNEALTEFLLEYCIERGHVSPHYLKAVAIGWSKEKFTDVAQAKQAVANRDKSIYPIMKELGLGSREPAPQEAETIRGWLNDFEADVICEACRRTISKIHEPNFSYVNGILSDWKEHGVTSLADVEALDKQYEEKKAASSQSSVTPTKKNSFLNGMERDNDYDSLMKILVES